MSEEIIKEAVILAAGLSTRLRDHIKEKSKVLCQIADRPLLAFPVEVLMHAGVEEFKIVANQFNHIFVRKIMKELFEVKFEVIVNRFPELGNGYSALLGARHVHSEIFILSMGDHIYAPSVIKKILRRARSEFDIIVGGDSSPRYIDVREATKILTRKDQVIRIGKNLREFTHVDIGVFVVKKSVLNEFISLSTRKITWSDIINRAVERGYKVVIADICGDYWTEIDTPNDLQEVLSGMRRMVIKNVLKQLEFRFRYEVMERTFQKEQLIL